MNPQNLSGLLLISGFALYFLAMVVAPRLYQEADLGLRMAIIQASPRRWNLSQLFFALGMLLPGIGFLILAFSVQEAQVPWPLYAGAGAFTVAGVLGALIIYRQTMDPLAFWEQDVMVAVGIGYLSLTLAGFLLIGLAMLESSLPSWVGYSNIAVAAVSSLVLLALRGRGAFFLTIFFYLIAMVDGIIILGS